MTLQEFIARKPVEARWETVIDELYNADSAKAKRLITQLMEYWQWQELPELENK